jgi:hypothetical protein
VAGHRLIYFDPDSINLIELHLMPEEALNRSPERLRPSQDTMIISIVDVLDFR